MATYYRKPWERKRETTKNHYGKSFGFFVQNVQEGEDFNSRSLTATDMALPEGHVILQAEQTPQVLHLVSMMQQYIHCVILFQFGKIVLMSGFLDAGEMGEEVNIYCQALC